MNVDFAEESSCKSLTTQKVTLQNGTEIIRAENFKFTEQVDKVSQELLKEMAV